MTAFEELYWNVWHTQSKSQSYILFSFNPEVLLYTYASDQVVNLLN